MNDQQVTVEAVDSPGRAALQGNLFLPGQLNGWGVLALNGSSGRLDEYTARLLAGTGAVAFAQRWFGQPGLPSEVSEVPLELFVEGIDLLVSRGCSRIALTGRSRGAEAALLVAANDERVKLVVAMSPSSVAWAGTGTDGRPSWTFRGRPIPFVSYDLSWWNEAHPSLVEYRDYHERSLRMNPMETTRAYIEVERSHAHFILVAGAADALWPSDTMAGSIAQRLRDRERSCTLLVHPDAGHRILLPGETTPRSQLHAHGGSDHADAELGKVAWEAVVEHMRAAH